MHVICVCKLSRWCTLTESDSLYSVPLEVYEYNQLVPYKKGAALTKAAKKLRENLSAMAFQAVQETKEDKDNNIVIVTSKTEYTFIPERQDMSLCVTNRY